MNRRQFLESAAFTLAAAATQPAPPPVVETTAGPVSGYNYWQRTALTWDTLPAKLGPGLASLKGPLQISDIIQHCRTWYPAYSPNDVYSAAIAASVVKDPRGQERELMVNAHYSQPGT